MLCNNAVSTIHGKMAMNGRQENIWKMVVMEYLKILCRRDYGKLQKQIRTVSSLANALTGFLLREVKNITAAAMGCRPGT
jgi:hypothetical protein